jgi:hypothetical protein
VILVLILLAVALFIWQLPALLRAIPSRYVAAYLPQPVQALAERDHVDILPTAEVQVDVGALLAEPVIRPMLAENLPPPVISTTVETTAGPTPAADEAGEPPATASAQPSSTPQPIATAAATSTPVPLPPAARLEPVRHHFQSWNNCGPATLAMGLSYFSIFRSQDETARVMKPDPEDRNVTPEEMAGYVKTETDLSAISRSNGSLDKLRWLLAEGIPVIVELGIDPPGEYRWMGWYGHYLLVVAYDDAAQQIWVYDSWFGTSEVPGENADAEGRMVSYEELDRYWRQFNRSYLALYRPEQTAAVETIIGSHLDDLTMWQEALARTQAELAEEPEDAFLWFNLGTNYTALGQYDRAAAAFDQARAIGLPWRMLWYQFGPYEAYYQTRRYQDLIQLTDVTLQNRPYFEESFYYRGLAEAALGNVPEARNFLEKAVRFNPNYAPAAEALAELAG